MNIIEILIPVAHAAESTANSSPIATLGLNAKLFIGQLVNFAILLFVFWKWILPGVTSALQKRTERIEKSLIDADRIEKEKQEFALWRQQEMIKARQEASAIVTKSQADAQAVKDQVLQQTKEDQQKLVDEAKQQIVQEKNSQLQSAKAEIADLVVAASEKILRSKLDEKKDAELIKESLSQISK